MRGGGGGGGERRPACKGALRRRRAPLKPAGLDEARGLLPLDPAPKVMPLEGVHRPGSARVLRVGAEHRAHPQQQLEEHCVAVLRLLQRGGQLRNPHRSYRVGFSLRTLPAVGRRVGSAKARVEEAGYKLQAARLAQMSLLDAEQ